MAGMIVLKCSKTLLVPRLLKEPSLSTRHPVGFYPGKNSAQLLLSLSHVTYIALLVLLLVAAAELSTMVVEVYITCIDI